MRRLLMFACAGWLLFGAGALDAASFASVADKARRAERRRDPDGALQAWSEALRLWNPADGKKQKAQALASRSALREKKGKLVEATQDLSEALQLDPKNAALLHRRGLLLLEQSQPSEAISDFYKAAALQPAFAENFFDRARAYEMLGDAKFAQEDFLTACRLGLKKACSRQ